MSRGRYGLSSYTTTGSAFLFNKLFSNCISSRKRASIINDKEMGNTDINRNNSWMYIVFVCLRAIYIVFTLKMIAKVNLSIQAFVIDNEICIFLLYIIVTFIFQ
jgi:hypothetical protein